MGTISKSNFPSDCNLNSYNLVIISLIAKSLHQRAADVVYSTYKQKNTILIFLTFDRFSLALWHIIIIVLLSWGSCIILCAGSLNGHGLWANVFSNYSRPAGWNQLLETAINSRGVWYCKVNWLQWFSNLLLTWLSSWYILNTIHFTMTTVSMQICSCRTSVYL